MPLLTADLPRSFPPRGASRQASIQPDSAGGSVNSSLLKQRGVEHEQRLLGRFATDGRTVQIHALDAPGLRRPLAVLARRAGMTLRTISRRATDLRPGARLAATPPVAGPAVATQIGLLGRVLGQRVKARRPGIFQASASWSRSRTSTRNSEGPS